MRASQRDLAHTATYEFQESPKFDKRAYQRDYNASDKGKESRRKYRHDKSKYVTDATYLSKPIVAIDGEGINVGEDHLYILLAVSGVAPIVNREGLTTYEILSYLYSHLSSANINVIYGGSYDFNCWLADMDKEDVRYVANSNYVSNPLWFASYGVRWIPGKSFEIVGDRDTVVINDVISFFQRPFVQACDEYLGESWEGRDIIVREKMRRGNFTADEVIGIAAYNSLELDRLVDLVTELRERLNRVGLRPRRWNSPGAIAAALFTREGVKQYRNEEIPEEVAKAARYAYAGGRFEMLKYGKVNDHVWEYDINSAYPRALLEVPDLSTGKWLRRTGSVGRKIPRFAMFRVRYEGRDPNVPGPVFVRAENGTISYPLKAENWIWTPEFEVLREYCNQVPGAKYKVIEYWEYIEANTIRPFAFIQELYDKRRELKRLKDGAHIGIKLALNSIYGKLAQQVGWIPATADRPMKVPSYHQLEWAGYVTSWCRANVLRAALTDLDAIIAFETDALFSSRPLNVDTGAGLGEWEETIFTSLTYVQSGHYYGTKLTDDGTPEEVVKCRGIDKGFISREAIERKLVAPETERILEAKLTRFYGARLALAQTWSNWRKWITAPKNLSLYPTGKRIHGACWCRNDESLVIGKWHLTVCPVRGGVSSPFPVEWIDGAGGLAELRREEKIYESA